MSLEIVQAQYLIEVPKKIRAQIDLYDHGSIPEMPKGAAEWHMNLANKVLNELIAKYCLYTLTAETGRDPRYPWLHAKSVLCCRVITPMCKFQDLAWHTLRQMYVKPTDQGGWDVLRVVDVL